ncbi:MAG: FtsX-like permease family protein [Bacteroides sp.]|nr:FtsX-like permease family protein [Bacteroides sp.]
MITHYLKVAIRNLLKYKVQSIISMVGLAIGLATFALSSIWLKYEMTYDTHWPDAERIYQIGGWEENELMKFSRYTSYLLPSEFKKNFPEIEEICAIHHEQKTDNGKEYYVLRADSAYNRIFPITILQGNDQFLYDANLAGITESAAIRMFGTTDVLGKTLSSNFRYNGPDGFTICALLKDAEGHSYYPYDIISSPKGELERYHSWGYLIFQAFIKLVPGVDVKAFDEKLKAYNRNENYTGRDGSPITIVSKSPHTIVPLSEMHYTYPLSTDAIRLEHIRLFNVVGLVVVLCALINYLILYVIRLYIRRREMTLRRAHGASEGSLLRMTMTELLVLTGIALFFGMLITELLYRPFKEITGINEGSDFLYRESAIYMGIVILLSLLLSSAMLMLQQRRSYRESLLPIASSGGIFTFRRVAMGVQLFISIFVLFATVTLQKQLRQLHQSNDMGINMDVVIAAGWISWTEEEVDPIMEQIPYIEYYKTENHPFDPQSYHTGTYEIWHDDDKGERQTIECKIHDISYDAYRVYGLQLMAGEAPKESGNAQNIWVNQAFAAKMGWSLEEAIGKQFHSPSLVAIYDYGNIKMFTIRGVVKDIQLSPILPPAPSIYMFDKEKLNWEGIIERNINRQRFFTTSIKDMKVLQDSVRAHLQRAFPHADTRYMHMGFYTIEEEIEKALQSERVLMKLLGIASGVCIFITLFGIFSMVSLTCERRRKEMAIRKVHGAKIRDIIGLFVKEYGILLLVSAAVAFSVGYAVMKQWLQTYVIQTTISWWIYVAILAAVTLMIVLCVGYRVWKAANENPADVVKSE